MWKTIRNNAPLVQAWTLTSGERKLGNSRTGWSVHALTTPPGPSTYPRERQAPFPKRPRLVHSIIGEAQLHRASVDACLRNHAAALASNSAKGFKRGRLHQQEENVHACTGRAAPHSYSLSFWGASPACLTGRSLAPSSGLMPAFSSVGAGGMRSSAVRTAPLPGR